MASTHICGGSERALTSLPFPEAWWCQADESKWSSYGRRCLPVVLACSTRRHDVFFPAQARLRHLFPPFTLFRPPHKINTRCRHQPELQHVYWTSSHFGIFGFAFLSLSRIINNPIQVLSLTLFYSGDHLLRAVILPLLITSSRLSPSQIQRLKFHAPSCVLSLWKAYVLCRGPPSPMQKSSGSVRCPPSLLRLDDRAS